MSHEGLSQNVCDFVSCNIDSLSQLEALLLFQKNPKKEWSAESLNQELRTNPQWCHRQIEWLLSKSFIVQGEQKGSYRYNETNAAAAVILELMKAYRERRITVINLISDRLVRIKEFADAFIFRKDSKETKDG